MVALALPAAVAAGSWRIADQPVIGVTQHAMAYDSKRNRLVIHGGLDADDMLSGRVLVYQNGVLQEGPKAVPGLTPRYRHAMAYDPIRDRVVLAGGIDDGGVVALDEVWELAGSKWQPGAPLPTSPYAGDLDQGMVFDSSIGAILYVRGGETWTYDGTWTILGRTPFAARRDYALARDSVNDRVILFGGISLDRWPTRLRDTWVFQGGV